MKRPNLADNPRLVPCRPADWRTVQTLARTTFSDTFASENDKADFQAYLDEAFADEKIQAELAEPHSRFFLLQTGEEIAGYLKLNEHAAQTEDLGPDATELERIYLRKKWQGHGLGRWLLQRAEELARANGKAFLWLGVWEQNIAAIEFYEKMGYQQFGTHVFTIGTDEQEDLLYRKAL